MKVVFRIFVGILLWLLVGWSVLGTTYYIAPSAADGGIGNDANDGLTALTPKTMGLTYSIAQGNTIIALPGTYATNIIIRTSNTTFRSSVKWGAIIDVPAGVNTTGIGIWPPPINNVIIDGFDVRNAGRTGVWITGNTCTVQNCWIRYSGRGSNENDGSGILTDLPHFNITIQNNLCESNGYSLAYDHGMYVAGTNNIYRYNVCRYNKGLGISQYSGSGASDNNQIYNNLLYGNYSANTDGKPDWQLGLNNFNTDAGTNYIFGNTIIATNSSVAIYVHAGTAMFTNNIIICTNGDGFNTQAPFQIIGDYNLANYTLETAGSHDVITNTAGWFVNTNSGLFWLKSTSPARGAAKTTVYAPLDFFGAAQSSVGDIGAFQYSDAYAFDSRVLDPSPATGADYWTVFNPSIINVGTLILR